jgi:Flp pilus assembly protein TadG
MAMTLPLLLLVTVAIFEFGRAYQTQQILTNAAREGARLSVLPNSSGPAIQTRVIEYLQQGRLSNPDSATVTVNPTAQIAMGATNVSASIVTVDYPFQWTVLGPVMKLVRRDSTLGSSALLLSASAQMRNESQF